MPRNLKKSPKKRKSLKKRKARSTKPVPANPTLYQKAKDNYKSMPHSAYKSGLIVQEYKRLGGTYRGKKPIKKGLSRWFLEDWRNQRKEIGYQHKRDIYRPTKRITAKTPITLGELTSKELERARNTKARKGRIYRFRKSPKKTRKLRKSPKKTRKLRKSPKK